MKDETRRFHLESMTPAELAIRNAMLEIEKLEPNEILSDIVYQLEKLKNRLGDYIDSK